MSHKPLPDVEVGILDTYMSSFTRAVTAGVNPDETLYTEVPTRFRGRATTGGNIRVLAQTPDDLFPVNDSSFEPPLDNYLICDRTGFRVSTREGLVEEWNGYMVRRESWEPRHPQDFVRSRPEKLRGSPRPEQADRFVDDEFGTGGVTVDDLDG